MYEEKFKEIKKKVTEYVEKEPQKCAIIGGVAILVVGYLTYRWWSGSSDKKNGKTARPEDEVKEVTPGNIDDIEEVKEKPKKAVAPSDSEDEPLILRQVIKVKRDAAGILDKESLVRIFDKRSTIRGMRKLDRTFKDRRRNSFNDQVQYK